MREWIADHSGAQYPQWRVVEPARPRAMRAEFRVRDFVAAMNGLMLAAICLIVAIPLLFFCCVLAWAIFVGARGMLI